MLSRDRISRLAALSLFFSALELFVPRILPFFRLGLANIPVLMALSLDWRSFLVMTLLKGIGTSYTAGNLFSPFAVVSIVQAIGSGAVMYVLHRFSGKWFSIYGISAAGALASTLLQLILASLYAGPGTMAFLPLMLLLSLPSALLTAFLSGRIPDTDTECVAMTDNDGSFRIFPIILLAVSGAAMMMTDDLRFLIPSVILSFILQIRCGRKVKLLPHLTLLLFMLVSSMLAPHGKVLMTLLSFPVTEGALLDGLSRSLRLSGGIALSQAFSAFIRPGRGLIGRTLAIFTGLLSAFRNAEGSLRSRFLEALRYDGTDLISKKPVNIPFFTLTCISSLITALAIADCVFF